MLAGPGPGWQKAEWGTNNGGPAGVVPALAGGDGGWAAGLSEQRGKASRGERQPWPPAASPLCRAAEGGGGAGAHVAGVLRRSVLCPPAGRLGRSMCSCGRHLAGSRSAGDVNQAGRKGP